MVVVACAVTFVPSSTIGSVVAAIAAFRGDFRYIRFQIHPKTFSCKAERHRM